MKLFRVTASIAVISLLLPGNIFLSAETQPPIVKTDPATITPDSTFTTQATGFAPNSMLAITYQGQSEGAARHIIEGYFGTTAKKTDETGAATFSGSTAVYDGGTMSFTFKDEIGNTAQGTVRVEGRAPRPFLFSPQVEVTEDTVQIGVTGVGWNAGKIKHIEGLTPLEEAYAPQFVDLCENTPCPEREDGLKLVALLPRSTPSGTHRFTVREVGNMEEAQTVVVIPELPENKAAQKQEAALLANPQTVSQHTESLLLRGTGWEQFDDRGKTEAFLFPKGNVDATIPLSITGNYRDCSFVVGQKIQGGCTMDQNDLLMSVALPKNLKEGTYNVSVVTNGSIGIAQITVVSLPDFQNTDRPIAAILPQSGPIGTPVLIAVGGFSKRTGLFIRFDGVKQKGIMYTDTDGAVGEYTFTIPATITKDFKTTTIKPGKHTIEINDGAGTFQTIKFTVTEEPKKEEPKKEEPKKEEPVSRFEGKPCDPILPRLWQQGCIDESAQKEVPAIKLYVPDSSGKQCRDDIAITFQPGCVSVIHPEAVNRFMGQSCDPNLPRSWQQGCIDQKEQQKDQKTSVQYYAPDSAGKPCRADLAITFQPGCVPQTKSSEPQKTAATPNQSNAQQAPATSQTQTAQKCNSQIPRYSQPGCVD